MKSLAGTIAESYACNAATVMPAYPADAPVPVLSALYASTAGTAARTFAFAAELLARSRNDRYDGIAIAKRMPRMMMTTSSSMRVKPLSSPASRCRILLDILGLLPWERTEWPGLNRPNHPPWVTLVRVIADVGKRPRDAALFCVVKEPLVPADSSFEAHAAHLFHRRFARADGRAQRVRPPRDHE